MAVVGVVEAGVGHQAVLSPRSAASCRNARLSTPTGHRRRSRQHRLDTASGTLRTASSADARSPPASSAVAFPSRIGGVLLRQHR